MSSLSLPPTYALGGNPGSVLSPRLLALVLASMQSCVSYLADPQHLSPPIVSLFKPAFRGDLCFQRSRLTGVRLLLPAVIRLDQVLPLTRITGVVTHPHSAPLPTETLSASGGIRTHDDPRVTE